MAINFSNPYGLIPQTPSTGTLGLTPQVTPQTPQPQQQGMDRNQRLAYILSALGGALKGQDPLQNIQQMQQMYQMREAKRLEEERQKKLQELSLTDPSLTKMYELFGERGLQQGYLQQQEQEQALLQQQQLLQTYRDAGLSDEEVSLAVAGLPVKDILELRDTDKGLEKSIPQLEEEVLETKGVVSEGLKDLGQSFGIGPTIGGGLASALGPISPAQIAPRVTRANAARQVLNERVREKFVSEYAGRPSVYLNTRIDALLPQTSYLTDLEAKQRYEEVRRVLAEGADEMKSKIESKIYTGSDLIEVQEQYKDIISIVRDLDVGIDALGKAITGDDYRSIYLPSNT